VSSVLQFDFKQVEHVELPEPVPVEPKQPPPEPDPAPVALELPPAPAVPPPLLLLLHVDPAAVMTASAPTAKTARHVSCRIALPPIEMRRHYPPAPRIAQVKVSRRPFVGGALRHRS
jgi:hypothetical protein